MKNIEIIVINDGSTDSTLEVVKSYSEKDKRICVIDKANEGYGKSMNRGLDAATGEYVGIVEGDDWVDSNMFQELVDIADKYKCDVVKSNFYDYSSIDGETDIKNNSLPIFDCNRVINPKKDVSVFLSAPAIWSGIYRREFLVENNIRFLETPGASYQDTSFNCKVLMMAKNVYLTSDAFLHYRRDNENSSVKSSGKIFCVCDEWNEVERYLEQYPDVKCKIGRLLPYLRFIGYKWNFNRLKDDARKQFLPEFQKTLKQYVDGDVLDKRFISDKDWYRIMTIVYPKSLKHKIVKGFFNLVRPVYRTDVSYFVKKYKLFGLVVCSGQRFVLEV